MYHVYTHGTHFLAHVYTHDDHVSRVMFRVTVLSCFVNMALQAQGNIHGKGPPDVQV